MKNKLNYTTIAALLVIFTIITIIVVFNSDPGIHLLGVRGFEIMMWLNGIFVVLLGLYLILMQISWGQRFLMRPDATELISFLKNGTHEEREIAARLLGDFHVVTAVDPLFVALEDGSSQVRRAAAESLYQISGAGPLLDRLPNLTPKAQIAVAYILLEHGDSIANLVAHADRIADPARGKSVHQAVLRAGVELLPRWLLWLEKGYKTERLLASETLGLLGQARIIPQLITRLDDKDPEVRAMVAQALGRLGTGKATQALILSLRDGDARVRIAAAEALAVIGDARAFSEIQQLLNDSGIDENGYPIRERITRLLDQLHQLD